MADIMLDVDDVMMPWAEVIRDEAVALGLIPEGTSWASWEQWSDWGIDKSLWFRAVASANIKGLYTKTAPYPGAVDAVNRLLWEGHRVHVVTARQGKHIEKITPEWFHDFGIGFTTMTFTRDKASAQEYLGVSFDYAIDDGIHNWMDLSAAGVNAYLMHQPHNGEANTARRVYNMAQFTATVLLQEELRDAAA